MNDFKNFPQISALIDDESLANEPLFIKTHFAKLAVAEFKAKFKEKAEFKDEIQKRAEFTKDEFEAKNAKAEFEAEIQTKNSKNSKNLDLNPKNSAKNSSQSTLKKALLAEIHTKIAEFKAKDYKRLINATGVVLHTNLGRSVIDESVFDECKSLACGYFNLEFDLNSGKRGERYGVLLEKLKILFGVEDALIVNNNAAAVFLVLNSLAKDKEVITSRGELVEIGGSFRVPEVMKSAGVKLVEIGTTNKTKLADYENAITCDTALLLKTHKSNFAFKGFYDEVPVGELYELSKCAKVPLYYDLGSGWCGKLDSKLCGNEPSINELVKECDILSFSGDKLFGSVQAGIILGKKSLINRLKSNQMLRMLRVDKITLTLINATLRAYLNKEFDKIPTLKLLNDSLESVKERALRVQRGLKIKCELKESKSLVGGGSMPDKALQSFVLAFFGKPLALQERFRGLGIIGRVENERFVLDFRSVLEKDLDEICKLINENLKDL